MKLDVQTVAEHIEILFGYKVTSQEDLRKIEHLVEYTKDFIMQYCNRKDIPEKIVHSTLDKIVGDFLFLKKSQGELEDMTDKEGNPLFDFNKNVSGVTLGDATVDFSDDSEDSGVSPEAQFDNLIDSLRDKHKFLSLLNTVRKVRWNVRRHYHRHW